MLKTAAKNLCIILSLPHAVSMAQNQPSVALLPWINLRALPIVTPKHKQWMQSQSGKLEKLLLTNPKSFAVFQKPISLNAKLMSFPIIVGSAKSSLKDLAITPLLCGLGDKMDVMFLATALRTDQILGVYRKTFDRNAFLANNLPALDQNSVVKHLQDQKQKAAQPNLQHALKLAIRSAKAWTRMDHGHHSCLDLRLGMHLTQSTPVISPVNTETTTHIRRMLGFKRTKPLRPTRTLLTHWEMNPKQIRLTWQMSESVFGQRIPGEPTTVTGRLTRTTALPEEIKQSCQKTINAAKLALDLTSRPKIAKVHGAWVYLDKGRAFGLKMNDRLLVFGREQEIKGHVVGFFGPNKGIKAANDRTINEGAIVYIRLGQNLTKIGQQLSFDPKRFPTPWPP